MTTCNDTVLADREHDEYDVFLQSIQQHLQEVTANQEPLFTTDATGLWEAFISNIPLEARQHYTCHACRHFIERYAGLVTIDESGQKHSALWGYVPTFFSASIAAMLRILKRARVTDVFYADSNILGQPVTHQWHHMSVSLPHPTYYRHTLLTANQRMAEKHEEFVMLMNGLQEYPLDIINQAVALLKTDSLYRSEKCLGVAEWLLSLHQSRKSTRDHQRKVNLVWVAVATAPPGWCHVKSTMIGTLLDDLKAGLSYHLVSSRFADKMKPTQYQRPQVNPTAGNIKQAEKLISELGLERSLERRFARLGEIQALWQPKEVRQEQSSTGIFSHITPKGRSNVHFDMHTTEKTMTWEKFHREVLPYAESIEYYVGYGRDNYAAITTALYDDAKPILQWDNEECRNPFSQYLYHNGSLPSQWNLATGYRKVNAVCYTPSMWTGEYSHQGKAVFFIIDGCKDTRYQSSGNALFPEILKSELHGIRATIEAYSRKAVLHGYEGVSACGVKLHSGNAWNAKFRVTMNGVSMIVTLDRWD